MIITRPEHEATTRYLSVWSRIVLDEAKRSGINVIDLHRKKANRKDFEGRLRKCNPKLVILQGHGNSTRVTGHDNEYLVAVGKNEELLEGRVTYAVSCDAAKELGERVGAMPHSTFIGYNDRFVFSYRPDRMRNPIEDNRAKPFMEMSNQVTRSLIKGHTANEAMQRSQDVGTDHVKRLMSSASDPDARFDAMNLLWDLRHQVCLGDGAKKGMETV